MAYKEMVISFFPGGGGSMQGWLYNNIGVTKQSHACYPEVILHKIMIFFKDCIHGTMYLCSSAFYTMFLKFHTSGMC